jgi:hydroxypyruvate reductase
MARLREDAEAIWSAAIRAVEPERLVAGQAAALRAAAAAAERVVVVGGGKAAAGMAAGIVAALGKDLLAKHDVQGLVSVPAGSGRSLERIEVRETRPQGVNLPTPEVVAATREMLGLVAGLGSRDLVLAVITGGGSALLTAPREGISLEEKITATKRLSEAGADIATLNAARREMSLVKGGGLARECRAGRLLALVLSDVISSDLAVIASGPCHDAAAVAGAWTTPLGCRIEQVIVGSNATAVDAAAAAAWELGYEVAIDAAIDGEPAEEAGRRLALRGLERLGEASRDGRPRAVIAGGEATVRVPHDHGLGGRNQQTALAALAEVRARAGDWPAGLVIASVGTDGEDGPTDAAGGLIDAEVAGVIGEAALTAALARCDAYPALAASGGLIRTGPTGTNVADVRIVLAG